MKADKPSPGRNCVTPDRPQLLPKLVSVREVAASLGVSCKLVYRLFAAGELRGAKVGGAVRIALESVLAYLDGRANVPAGKDAPRPEPEERKPTGQKRRARQKETYHFSPR